MGLGNWTPAAEFNIYVDPEAAEIVFQSGIPVVMAGLDVTHKAQIHVEDTERFRAIRGGFRKKLISQREAHAPLLQIVTARAPAPRLVLTSSFANMAQRQRQVADVILQDPAVQSLTSFVGVDGTNPSLNSARLQINLKPLDERDDRSLSG